MLATGAYPPLDFGRGLVKAVQCDGARLPAGEGERGTAWCELSMVDLAHGVGRLGTGAARGEGERARVGVLGGGLGDQVRPKW